MSGNACLNCGEPVEKNFCPNCGQKTDTHRITLHHFFFHDLLHGFWHIDKGILFTIKEVFVRPGQAALDYINGKRIRYYNIFYLCLLVIGLNLLLSHLYDSIVDTHENLHNDTQEVNNFFEQNIKSILLGIIPILALSSLLIFHRLKLNLAEQFILSGFCLLGILILGVFFNFFDFLNKFEIPKVISYFEAIAFFSIPLFACWTYFNAAKQYYSWGGFLWRIVAFFILVLTVLFIVLGVIVSALTSGKGHFNIDL